MSRRRTHVVGDVLVEIVSVVFAVTLALALNGWREGVKTRHLVDAVLLNLAEETAANRALTEDVLAYHDTALTHMAEFRGEHDPGTVPKMLDVVFPNGLRPAILRESAWNTAVASGVVPDLPYETVRHLSAVYTIQTRYDRFSENLLQTVYQSILASDILTKRSAADVVQAIDPMVRDLASFERAMDDEYQVLDSILPKPASDTAQPSTAPDSG